MADAFSDTFFTCILGSPSFVALLLSHKLSYISVCYFLPIFHISNVTEVPRYHFLSIYTHFLKYLIYSQGSKCHANSEKPHNYSAQISFTKLQTVCPIASSPSILGYLMGILTFTMYKLNPDLLPS